MTRLTKWIAKVGIVFGLLLLAGTPLAQAASKAQQAYELIPLLKDIPGISKLPVRNVHKHGGVYTSADVTLHGRKTTIVKFKENGIQMGAVVPSDFKLTDVLPIPSDTPFDGVRFPHVAVIYLPAGHQKQTLNVSALPNPVRIALQGQSSVSVNAGLNLLGKADFSSSRAVKQVLQAVGVSNFSLPLSGTFSTDLFKADLKQADQLLDNLHLNFTLPQLRIPHMPSSVAVKKGAQFSIVAKKLKNATHREYFAGVNGDLTAKIGTKTVDFDFYVLAEKSSANKKVTLKGDTDKRKTTVKVGDFTLDSLNLTAVKDGNKWDVAVNATSELKNKKIGVSASVPAHGSPKITITSQMTLAELTSLNVPGLTDVKLDSIEVEKGSFQAKAKIKKTEVDIATFKKNGRTYIAVATPKPIHISNLIPQIGKTPLDDVSFDHMSYIWAPQGGALNELQVSELPKNVQGVMKENKTSFAVKVGLNVLGQLGIEKNGDLGKMLSAVGAYKSSLPLQGVLSPSVFTTKGSASQIKNDILDHLHLNIPLDVSALHLPKAVTLKTADLKITGVNKGGTRTMDVNISGELDVQAHNEKVAFTYGVDIQKPSGQLSKVVISGGTKKKGMSLHLPLVSSFQLTDMTFNAEKSGSKAWDWDIEGKSTFRNKAVDASYAHDKNGQSLLQITTKMTLADIVGQKNLPGLDDMELDYIAAHSGLWNVQGKVKGEKTYIQVQKPKGGTDHLVAVHLDDLSLASLIPGGHSSSSPLNRVKFDNMVALYNPGAKTKLSASGLSDDALKWVKASSANPELKKGLNIFGHIDAQTSGELKSMLSQVGVKDLKLPLKGAISPESFSQNLSSAKTAVLNALDVNVPLNFSIPGAPKSVSVQRANLEIKGKDAKGNPALNVDVKGILEFAQGSSKADFKFNVDVVKHEGHDKIMIKANEVKGETLKISMIEEFELSEMTFAANNIYGTWATYVGGYATVRGTKIGLVLGKFPGKADVIGINTKGLTLAELIGEKGLPGIDGVELTKIDIYGAYNSLPARMIVKGDIKGHPASMQIQKASSGKHFIAIDLGNFNLGSLIPGAKSSPLKDVEFSNMVMVHNPTSAAVKLKSPNISGDAQSWIQQSNQNPTINPGMNVFGHMHLKTSGHLKTLLHDVGVRDVKLPLNGRLSPKAFEQSILKNLDIKVNLPKLAIPGVGQYLTLTQERLEISGKKGLAVKVKADADVKVKDESLAFDIEVDYNETKRELDINGSNTKVWRKPFGISYLDLDNLTLGLKRKKTNTVEYDLDIGAKAKVGRHSNLDVQINIVEDDGRVTDATFQIDGPMKLSDIPEVNKVPHADRFTLNKLIISEHGLEADTTFNNHKTDFFAFHGSGWNVALTQTDFNLGELITVPGDFLKEISFPFAAVMLSESGLNKPYNELSKVGRDAMKDIFSGTDNINIKKGLAFVAGFHPAHAGSLGKPLGKMGVGSGIAIMGEIGGLYGGAASVTLAGELANAGSHSLPSFMDFAKNEQIDFFIKSTKTELDIGIQIDITTKIKSDTLTFDTSIAVADVDGGELGLSLNGSMDGSWHKPFDIPGFTIDGVTINATVDDAGVELGFGGSTTIDKDKFVLASEIQFSEALVPDAGAFTFSADSVDIFFVQEVLLNMLGDEFKLDIPAGIFPTFDKPSISFVSPGAKQLKVGKKEVFTKQGFHMSGGLDWLGHKDLGEVKLTIDPTSGIDAAGDISPMKIGPLDLKKNDFKIDIDIADFAKGDFIPTINLTSNIEIEYLDIHDDFEIALNKNGMSFESKVNAGSDFSYDATFMLSGVDLSAAHPGFKDADFAMEGDIKMDIGEFIGKPMKKAVDVVFNELNSGFADAEKALDKAQAKVDHLTGEINAEREKVRKERQAAEKKVDDAEKRVDHLRSKIDDAWKSYHSCHGLFKWFCEGAYAIEIGILKAAMDVAEEALKFAATLIDHFPIDLDPRVGILIAARDVADGVLELAKYGVEGLDVITKIQKKVDGYIADEIEKSVNIRDARYEVDLRKMIEKGDPAIVSLNAEIFGGNIKQTLPLYINPKDIGKNVEKMAIVGLHGLSHLAEKVIDEVSFIVPGSLRHKLHNHIASHANARAKTINGELVTYKQEEGLSDAELAAFKKVLNQKINVSNNAYMKRDRMVSVLLRNGLDNLTTKTFTSELLEAGHTGLCLDNVKGDIRQDNCTDASATRWSTVNLTKKDTHTYVNIIDAKSKNCVAPVGTWKKVTKTYSDDKFGSSASFTFKTNVFTGDGEITVRKCGSSSEFAWKVLDHGTNWMLMANQATQKCVHFTASSAIPGHAKAEWKPCVGSANQVFRIMDSATPKYYANQIALKNDQLGLCVGEANKDTTVPMTTCDKAAYYDYMVDDRGYAKFINHKTGNCLQPDGYKLGAEMIEVPCTQLDYQWWDGMSQAGGIIIKNAQTKRCTNPPSEIEDVPPTQVDCDARNNAVLTPLKAMYRYTGPTWKVVTSTTIPPKSDLFKTGTSGYVCSFKHKGSFVPGILIDKSCMTTLSGTLSQFHSTGKFRVLMNSEANDMVWLRNAGKKLQRLNIPTGGFGVGTKGGAANIYTCRAPGRKITVNTTNGFKKIPMPAIIGWTADGKLCHAIDSFETIGIPLTVDVPPATEFDILSRWDKAAFVLQGSAAETIQQPTEVPGTPKPKPKPVRNLALVKHAPVWIVGTDNAPYAWNAQRGHWMKQKGCLKQISVDAGGQPLGIRCDDEAIYWNGTDWISLAGRKGKDIGGGRGATWLVGMDNKPYKWTGKTWEAYYGCMKRIAVDPWGAPVAIDCNDVTMVWSDKNNKWVTMGGKGVDIGSGSTIWMVGTANVPYEWANNRWNGHGGCFKRIDVDSHDRPWVIGCKNNNISRWTGTEWIEVPGKKALDIAMDPRGKHQEPPKAAAEHLTLVKHAPVWIVGTDNAPYAWNAQRGHWMKQKGCLKQISVDAGGQPLGIRCDDEAIYWNGTDWISLAGRKGKDIGGGMTGVAWLVGMDNKPYKWTGKTWEAYYGCMKRIAVDPWGAPVAIDCNDVTMVWSDKNNKWVTMGGKGVDIGSGSTIWMVGTAKVPYEWADNRWNGHGGCFRRIDVDPDNHAWVIGCKNNHISRWTGTEWVEVPGDALDIALDPRKKQ